MLEEFTPLHYLYLKFGFYSMQILNIVWLHTENTVSNYPGLGIGHSEGEGVLKTKLFIGIVFKLEFPEGRGSNISFGEYSIIMGISWNITLKKIKSVAQSI